VTARWESVLPELEKVVAVHARTDLPLRWIAGYMDRTAVFEAGDGLILKVYFHAADVKWTREVFAYDFLAGARLPVARKVAGGRLPDGTPWLILERMPGELLSDVAPSLSDASVWTHLGALLARLHAVSPGTAALAAERQTGFERKVVQRVDEYLTAVERECVEGWPAEATAWLRAWTAAGAFHVEQLCFAHGDFSARNVLVQQTDGAAAVTGIFDFEKAEFAEAALDIAKMIVAEWDRPRALEPFLRGYTEAGGGGIATERVAFYVAYIAVDAALWAPAGDPAYFARLLAVLRAALDRRNSFWRGAFLTRPQGTTAPTSHYP
jgi:aminoglycoside phosphotransferase (APT) family kinase protein